MSESIPTFKPKISNINLEKGELRFIISGDDDYGFDKSLVNAIRRVLLTDIPTIGFNINENGENNDIQMPINNSSLHNEMLIHRIALVPLYINPENYMKNYLFECNVKHDTHEPFKFVTMNDVNIYPLNSSLKERVEHYNDDSYDMSDEDIKLLKSQLDNLSIDNYDLSKPLSQKEKDKIFRPFNFRNTKNYSLITELKNTNTEDKYQEIHFYGSPSIGYGHENARFQGVSQATYSFTINETLVEDVLSERINVENIDQDKIEDYSTKFRLSESERYYFRDNSGNSNSYDFAIKSNHYYNSEELFKLSIDILIDKCENLKLEFIKMLKEELSRVVLDQKNDYVFHFTIEKETHTLGNLLQSHIMRRCINEETLVNLCGYKKPHPLEDKILMIVSIHKNHKLSTIDNIGKIQNITTFILESIDTLVNDLRIFKKISDKSF